MVKQMSNIKDMTSVCKIYLLTNKINNKIYIGQTWLKTLAKRFGPEGSNYKNSTYLYSAIQKYGHNNFEYTLLAEVETQEEADKLERQYIEQYNSRDNDIGYNIKEGGSAGCHSEETKLKISQNHAKAFLGKTHTNDAKQKVSEANTGRLHTDEWKENNSTMMKEYHATHDHPMLGKHHTEEAKQKISEAGKGPVTPEHLAILQANAEKRKMDPARESAIVQAYLDGKTIKSMKAEFGTSESSIYRVLDRNNVNRKGATSHWAGRTHTEETKAKMATAREEYWKNK